ncbi:MAG: hypothetical protein AB1668_05730 [Nanoarchaeota archaeon]
MATVTPTVPQEGFEQGKLYVWVKGLESKVNNLVREIDVLKNDFIKRSNQLNKDLKTATDDLVELKHEQEKTLQKMDLIISELKKTAGSEEVAMLKKYIDLWNPLNFVTQRDLQRAVENMVNEKNLLTNTEKNKGDKGKSDEKRANILKSKETPANNNRKEI